MKSKGRLARLALALVILSILAVPMTVSAAPPTPPSGPTSPGTTAVPVWGEPTTVRSRYGLRLREGPSLYNRIILVLHNGETVTRGAGPVWGGGRWWTYVRVWRWGTYYEGFCASAYLANYDPGAPPSGGGDLMVTGRDRAAPALGAGHLVWRVQGHALWGCSPADGSDPVGRWASMDPGDRRWLQPLGRQHVPEADLAKAPAICATAPGRVGVKGTYRD